MSTAFAYGDDAPDSYVRHLLQLGIFLKKHKIRIHPLDAPPIGITQAAMLTIMRYQETHQSYSRVTDYLLQQGYLDHVPPLASTDEVLVAILQQYEAMVRTSPALMWALSQRGKVVAEEEG